MSLRKVLYGSVITVSAAMGWDVYTQNERAHRRVIMPFLHGLLDGENAHRAAVLFARSQLIPQSSHEVKPSLSDIKVWDLVFPNPVGLAAGFDKDGECVEGISRCGFGFVEVGSVTPLPQPGNEKPRVFRLYEDKGVINRYGFNSAGHDSVALNLREYRAIVRNDVVVGVNLGKNKESASATDDYVSGVHAFSKLADYLVVNVSSPNTPGLRELQGKKQLNSLISSVMKARDEAWEESRKESTDSEDYELSLAKRRKPILVKIAPDLSEQDKKDIADVIRLNKVDGIIVSNTTVSRPATLKNGNKVEVGGLSGKPLRNLATQTISDMYRLTEGKVPIIGVGGIFNGKDAIEKIKAGATMVQVYTALIYSGFPVVKTILREMEDLVQAEGCAHISELVGANHRK